LKTIVLLLGIPLLLAGSAILLNRPALLAPPGPWQRLRVYLTSNVAQTASEHAFPELRLALYRQTADVLRGRVIEAMQALGWQRVGERNG